MAKKLDKTKTDEAIRLWRCGESLTGAGSATGISRGAIAKLLQKTGLRERTRKSKRLTVEQESTEGGSKQVGWDAHSLPCGSVGAKTFARVLPDTQIKLFIKTSKQNKQKNLGYTLYPSVDVTHKKLCGCSINERRSQQASPGKRNLLKKFNIGKA